MKVFKEDSSKTKSVLLTDEMKRKFHRAAEGHGGMLYDTIRVFDNGVFEMLSVTENGVFSCGKSGRIDLPKELAELFEGKDELHFEEFESLETDILN